MRIGRAKVKDGIGREELRHRERFGGARSDLVVGRFGLDHAHEDVGGVDYLVLVQNGVFGGGAVEPDGAGALDEKAAADVDVDLCLSRRVEVLNTKFIR